MFWNKKVKMQTRVYPVIIHKNYLEITEFMPT